MTEGQEPRLKISHPSESQSPLPGRSLSWRIAIMLRIVSQSVGEGFAAHRRYHELTSKGIPHDMAIRQALGIPRVRR